MQAATLVSSFPTVLIKGGFQEVLKKDSILSEVSGGYFSMVFETLLGQLFPSQGFLLLDEDSRLLQSTSKGRELCRSIQVSSMEQKIQYSDNFSLPQKVVELCTFLADSRVEFPDRPLHLSDEIFSNNNLRIRLTAEWIMLSEQSTVLILVRLEDIIQISGQRALCDAARYGLTPRETEAWALYLQGLSYRQIGEQMFIALCTVKKHMKNISSKRRCETF